MFNKHRRLFNQFMRYFSAALAGYLVDFGTLILLTELLNVHYLIAAITGFTLGLIVVYLLSKAFVFKKAKTQSKTIEFLYFAGIGIIGLLLLTTLMWLFTDILHINYIVSKIIATIFVYVSNFFARRALYVND